MVNTSPLLQELGRGWALVVAAIVILLLVALLLMAQADSTLYDGVLMGPFRWTPIQGHIG